MPNTGPAMDSTLLEVHDLEVAYGAPTARLPFLRQKPKPIVREATFTVKSGETVALVGESGSGKTTIARAISGLLVPTQGQIRFDNQEITVPVERRTKELHRQIQLVFQNPDASLNPRRRIAYILGRPLEFFFGLSGEAKQRRIEQLLQDVHLDTAYARRFPTQLSGGERQRVAIAQALAAEPRLILCDEIVSALDVSVQAAILDLLRELQAKRGLAYLFIAHDLAVVRWLAHRVVVLYRGYMMETGTSVEVFSPPYHPYTEMLLQSVPEPDPSQPLPAGDEQATDVASPESNMGCPFASRCPRKVGAICDQVKPPWQAISPTHAIYCHILAPELLKMQVSPSPLSA